MQESKEKTPSQEGACGVKKGTVGDIVKNLECQKMKAMLHTNGNSNKTPTGSEINLTQVIGVNMGKRSHGAVSKHENEIKCPEITTVAGDESPTVKPGS